MFYAPKMDISCVACFTWNKISVNNTAMIKNGIIKTNRNIERPILKLKPI